MQGPTDQGKANDIAHLVDEQRIGRQLEELAWTPLQRGRLLNAGHVGGRPTGGFRYRPGARMARCGRHGLQRHRHHSGDLVIPDLAWSGGTRLIARAVHPLGGEPPRYRQSRGHQLPGDGQVRHAIRCSSTIEARIASPREVFRRRGRASSSARSSSHSSMQTASCPGILFSPSAVSAREKPGGAGRSTAPTT